MKITIRHYKDEDLLNQLTKIFTKGYLEASFPYSFDDRIWSFFYLDMCKGCTITNLILKKK